ncbi:MAG TPA: serine/threonine-protein kinase, partial [Nannocystis sp.]
MLTQPAIDGEADTVAAEPSQPYGADFARVTTGAESALTTEAVGDGGGWPSRRLPVVGEQLGDFTLLSRLGEGGMGVVYEAWSHKLARRVAIKIPTRALDPVIRARLVREAQSLAQVDHPNVVRVFEVVDDERGLFIVMELVEGLTLRRWQTEARRDWRTVLGMYLQAGRGLAAAHQKGLIHRDFKPSNILVDREGKVRLIDFGLARMRDSSPRVGTDPGRESPATDTADDPSRPDAAPQSPEFVLTSRAGTPRYMAPELYETGAIIDARSDQYAFCVALWEGLFGELPDWRRTVPAGRPVPAWLVRVLRRGLALAREDRYPTMDALLADLTAGLQPPRRWRPFAALALTAVLGAGAGLAARPGPDQPACPP